MNRVKTVIIFLLLFPAVISGQPVKKFNLEIFEEGISSGIEKFFYYPDVNRNFQFVFVVNDEGSTGFKKNEVSRFLTSIIRKTAEKDNIRYSIAKDSPPGISNDSVYYIVKISDIKLKTSYPRFIKKKFLGDKTIERKINGSVNIDMLSSDSKFSHSENIVLQYTDEIDFDTYESYETPEYDFTIAKPPKANAFESFLFPALLVTVSAVATVLFFAIRSK